MVIITVNINYIAFITAPKPMNEIPKFFTIFLCFPRWLNEGGEYRRQLC